MSTGTQLLALMKSHVDGDDDHFYAVALQVAAHEARQGHTRIAQELRSLIDAARKERGASKGRTRPPLPLAQPKGDLASLIDVQYSDIRLSSMILKPEMDKRLHRILLEVRQQHRLLAHGLKPRRKILLLGPPGCGKTMTAGALSGELHLPLFTVLLDGLITKFMGETASKLRVVFDAIAETRGVYFFDEFDAIGARRDGRNDVGEIRRVLNSFLQFLEKDQSDSLIIAATNHPELLDRALFRRFDDVLEYSIPDEDVANRLFLTRLSGFATTAVDWRSVIAASNGLSQAEITRVAEEAAKHAVLSDREIVSEADLLSAIAERKIFNNTTAYYG